MADNNWLDHSSIYSQQHTKFYKWVLYPMVGFLLSLGIFLGVAKTEVVIRTEAQLTSRDTVTVQVPVDATIKENYLAETKRVNVGEVLVSFDLTDVQTQHAKFSQDNQTIDAQKKAIATLIASLEQDVNLFQEDDRFGYANQVKAYLAEKESIHQTTQQLAENQKKTLESYAKTANQLNQQVISRQAEQSEWHQIRQAWVDQQELQGFSSAQESSYLLWQELVKQAPIEQQPQVISTILSTIDDRLNQLTQTIEQLQMDQGKLVSPASANGEINSQTTKVTQSKEQLMATVKAKKTELDATQAQNDSTLVGLTHQLREKEIKAEIGGTLHLNKDYQQMNKVPKGTVLAEIYPEALPNQRSFTAQLPASDMTYVKKGMKVHFRLDKKGVSEKVIDGNLTEIDEMSTSTKTGVFYTVTGVLKPSMTTLDRYGLVGELSLIIGKKTYWHHLKDTLLNQD